MSITLTGPVTLSLSGQAPAPGVTACYADPVALGLLARNPAYSWEVSVAQRGRAITIYRCCLTGANDGLGDLELPVASWQARLRDGEPSYLSCVIPSSHDYETGISLRTNGEIVIRKGVRLRDATEQLEEIARVDYENVQVNRGAKADSLTITGYRTVASSAPKEWTVSGVSFYGLQADGKRRIRADLDLFLRCGDTCIYGTGGNDYFVVGSITYWVAAYPAAVFMEVGEA
jgi:hypothetical protein